MDEELFYKNYPDTEYKLQTYSPVIKNDDLSSDSQAF